MIFRHILRRRKTKFVVVNKRFLKNVLQILVMFWWFSGKKEVERVKEETQKGFENILVTGGATINSAFAKEKLLDVMLKESISGSDIIKSIQKEIWNLQVDDELKVRLTEKTGETEFRIVEGSDPFIQLQSLLASFVLAGLGK